MLSKSKHHNTHTPTKLRHFLFSSFFSVSDGLIHTSTHGHTPDATKTIPASHGIRGAHVKITSHSWILHVYATRNNKLSNVCWKKLSNVRKRL